MQEAWAWSTAAGLNHLCQANIWNDEQLVQYHYFSAFLAFQAGCRQQIASLHHAVVLAGQSLQPVSTQVLDRPAGVGRQQQVSTRYGSHFRLSCESRPNPRWQSNEENSNVYLQHEPVPWLCSNLASKTSVHSRTQAKVAVTWIVDILLQLRHDSQGAGALRDQASESIQADASQPAHSNVCPSLSDVHATTTPCDTCQSQVDWFALSGVDLDNLSGTQPRKGPAYQQSIGELLLALCTVLQADAATEYRGNPDPGATATRQTSVRGCVDSNHANPTLAAALLQ